jgi:hypothetical protein
MNERTHWESTSSGATAEASRIIAVMMVRDLTMIQTEIRGVQRMRRHACRLLDAPDRQTDTDVRLDLAYRLIEEVGRGLGDWLNAQVVALHDPRMALELRDRATD